MTESQNRPRIDRAEEARNCVRSGSFETFYKTYYKRLVRYLKSQANNATWAEDVAEDAMMKAMDKWDDLLTMDRPDSWLFKVAIRRLKQLESRAREQCSLREDLASTEKGVRLAAVRDEWVEDHLDLIAGMRSLPRKQCEVIGLHYLGGYTIAETAQILGIPESTARSHKARGMENLRQRRGAPAALKLIRRIPA